MAATNNGQATLRVAETSDAKTSNPQHVEPRATQGDGSRRSEERPQTSHRYSSCSLLQYSSSAIPASRLAWLGLLGLACVPRRQFHDGLVGQHTVWTIFEWRSTDNSRVASKLVQAAPVRLLYVTFYCCMTHVPEVRYKISMNWNTDSTSQL